MRAIDFFCGGGGMTKGLLNANIEVQFGLDFNPSCQKTYEYNNHIPYICNDIRNVYPEELIHDYPILRDNNELLMVGCAPCQPFSKQRRSEVEHVALNLLDEFGRLVRGILPAHVLIENVPGIENSGHAVFERFLLLLQDLGYDYVYGVLNAKNFGVPQNRKRLILIASRLFEPRLPEATHGDRLIPYVTVFDAIYRFPEVAAGDENKTIFNHKACGLTPINMRRIESTPHNGGGRIDWPEDLRLDCHKNGHTGHTDVYGRMAWESVAPTLTSKCFSLSNGRFGHPEQNRAITLREAASLQSFPDDYKFFGNVQEIGRQVGNAVPVKLAESIGRYILQKHDQVRRNTNLEE